MQKQVDKTHYQFKQYMLKERWISTWHQLDEVMSLNPSSVLEIGSGPKIFKVIFSYFSISIETVDIDLELKPDYVASATKLPFKDNSYDCVCSFQMLEHLPYEQALQAFGEMSRVARKNIVVSLPDAKRVLHFMIQLPKIGLLAFNIPILAAMPKIHKFDGQHYWEINKRNYPLEKIANDFSLKNVHLLKTYRVGEHPYHRFFIFEK
jgi:predicted SAM-dependent methyltransferase